MGDPRDDLDEKPESAAIGRMLDAVVDGHELDWGEVEAGLASPDERQLVPQLKAVADLRKALRAVDDEGPVLPSDSSGGADADLTAWGPLEVRGKVGAGTFGTVYRVWQPGVERDVALKLLYDVEPVNGKAVSDEARLLARIRHNNVVTIFGADCFDGRVGLWMEFIEGRTLKEILQDDGEYCAEEATVLALPLCRALAAVHQAGFLHCDVKAQNVMRARGGRIVLMDFGAAALTSVIPGARTRRKGTPLYLAPEVLHGGAPTVRSDLYSLGVLLYYMVSGEFPVTGRNVDELRAAHERGQRTPLRDVRPDIPAAFRHVVDEATALLPEQRPQSAGALESLLENAASRLAIARVGPSPAAKRRSKRTNAIAVLPFVDMSPEQDLDYFCEGIAEETINALMMVPGLRVVARSSAFKFGSRIEDVRQVGSLLNVGTVLEGSVRRSHNQLRVIARVIDTTDGEQIWSQRFERELDDLFAVQDEIADAAVGVLGLRVSHERRPASTVIQRHGTRDIETYTLYLKGRHHWNQRTEAALHTSAEYFLAAIEREPDYAQAYAGLALAYATLGLYGVFAPRDIMPKAKAAAERAIELAGTLSIPHATAGCVAAVYDWSWQAAETYFRRAIELNPDDPDVHHWYAINYLVPLKRFDEANNELRCAADADPLSMPIQISLGLLSYFSHRFDQAYRELSDSLRHGTGSGTGRLFLGLTLVENGRYDDAVNELETASRLSDSPEMTAALGYAFARAGYNDRARQTIEQLLTMSKNRYISASLVAQVYAGMGETLAALEWLEKACDAHAVDLAWLGVRPVFDALRAEPRFDALLSRLGR
jgi:eukaryotic-like serine/threonine-protein kinase